MSMQSVDTAERKGAFLEKLNSLEEWGLNLKANHESELSVLGIIKGLRDRMC